MRRYEAKAEELGIGLRTLRRWVNDFRQCGEAGLVESAPSASPTGRVDDQWVETAVEVMVEHSDQSRPSRTMVIDQRRVFQGQVRRPDRGADCCRIRLQGRRCPGHRRLPPRCRRSLAAAAAR